jgi:3-oxoacyl-[acyl-carrier-protein] synthase III
LAVSDLGVIVPHQANKRILEAIERRVGRPVLCAMGELGNTSSSSIPFALMEAGPGIARGERVGLAAFGGGASFAAAVATKS